MSGKERLFLVLFLIPAGLFLMGVMGCVGRTLISYKYDNCQDRYVETRGTWVIYDTQVIGSKPCSRRKQGSYDNVWESPYSCFVDSNCNAVALPVHIIVSLVVPIVMIIGIGCLVVGVIVCFDSIRQFSAYQKLKNN